MNLLKLPWPADRTPGSIIKNPDYFMYNMNSKLASDQQPGQVQQTPNNQSKAQKQKVM